MPPPASSTYTHFARQARKVSAGGQHEPFDAHDVTTDPPVTKLPLQADLNQRKEGEQTTSPAAFGQCIDRFAAAAALATSG